MVTSVTEQIRKGVARTDRQAAITLIFPRECLVPHRALGQLARQIRGLIGDARQCLATSKKSFGGKSMLAGALFSVRCQHIVTQVRRGRGEGGAGGLHRGASDCVWVHSCTRTLPSTM